MFRVALRSTAGVLSAGRRRPAATLFGGLVRALPVVVAAKCGAWGLSLVGPDICWAGRWHARSSGRGVVSRGPGAFRVGFLRLVAGLGDWCRWRPARLQFRR